MVPLILAGGRGTRLGDLTKDRPKPMVDINGVPFLHHLLCQIQSLGFDRVAISICYLGNQIRDHFGDKFQSLDLMYIEEAEPLGTGGACLLANRVLPEENLLLLNGDTLVVGDISGFVRYCIANKQDACLLTKKMPSSDRYGYLKFSEDDHVIGIEKRRANTPVEVFAGIAFLSHASLNDIQSNKVMSFEQILQIMIQSGVLVRSMPCGEDFIDIGIPDDLQKLRTSPHQYIAKRPKI